MENSIKENLFLNSQNQNYVNKLDDLSLALHEKLQEIQSRDLRIEILTNEILDTEDQLKSKSKENSLLKSEIKQMLKDQLKKQMAEQIRDENYVFHKHIIKNDENENLKCEILKKDSVIKEFENKLKELNERLQVLLDYNDFLSKESISLKQDNNELRKTNAELEETTIKLKIKKKNLHRDISKLQNQNSCLLM